MPAKGPSRPPKASLASQAPTGSVVPLEARLLLPDLRLEEQGLTARQADQAVVVFHHFGLDQFALAFNLQGHPGRRAQRTDIAHLGRMVVFQLMPRQ